MNIEQKLLTPNKYSRPQTKLAKVTKIAIHYVGNAGSTAIANRNYFENLKSGANGLYASSHYIIGLNGEIIQCVPENEIAYTTNAANSYSIGIENCHPSADGKFNDKTNQSLIELCADLCTRYKLNPLNDLIRHYDVTGKKCPLYHVNNPSAWTKLKQDVYNYMNKKEVDDELVETIKIKINGKEYSVDRILKDDRNYIKINDFAQAGFVIGYDANAKTASIDSPKN